MRICNDGTIEWITRHRKTRATPSKQKTHKWFDDSKLGTVGRQTEAGWRQRVPEVVLTTQPGTENYEVYEYRGWMEDSHDTERMIYGKKNTSDDDTSRKFVRRAPVPDDAGWVRRRKANGLLQYFVTFQGALVWVHPQGWHMGTSKPYTFQLDVPVLSREGMYTARVDEVPTMRRKQQTADCTEVRGSQNCIP